MARQHIFFFDPPADGTSSRSTERAPGGTPAPAALEAATDQQHAPRPTFRVSFSNARSPAVIAHHDNNNTVQRSDTPAQRTETPIPPPPLPWHGALPYGQNLRHQLLLPPSPPSPPLPFPPPSTAAAAAAAAPKKVKPHLTSGRPPRVAELETFNAIMSGQRPLEPKQNGMLNITVEDFIRHRDSVVTGLTTLIGNINDFNRAFIRDTNMMLGGDGGEGSYAITNFMQTTQNIFNPADSKVKKEKKKKEPRDPNLPKRPLTAYFLFQHHAKSVVQKDLPEGSSSKEVADEMLRRWTNMSDEEKQKWKDRYKVSMQQYDKDMLVYNAEKGGKTAAHGEEADDSHVGATAAEASDDDSSDDNSETEESAPPTPPPPPPKPAAKPTKKASRKKESAPAAPAKSPSPSSQLTKETPIPPPETSDKKTGKDSKRKRPTKEEAPAAESAPVAAPAATEPPAKKSKKSSKAAANGSAPTEAVELPASSTPAAKEKKEKKESKKKRKSDAA